jgi:ferritin-like metal-binding protein YciE
MWCKARAARTSEREDGRRSCTAFAANDISNRGETPMADMGTLHEAFVEELRDIFDGEKQLTKALPKMAKAANSPELREAIEAHLEETRQQVQRLEQVFATIEEKPRGKHCDGIAGIIEEGQKIM